MRPWTDIGAAAALAAMAALLARFPRRLFREAAGEGLSARHDPWLGAGLFAAGLAAWASGLGSDAGQRGLVALSCEVLAAVAYADLRFMLIPDLYSALLALLALAEAARTGDWPQAGLGAAVCGGLLGVVAYLFKRLRGIDGIGLGDVKLAAGLGALMGPLWGVRAIAVAAVCAALALSLFILARRRAGREPAGPPLAPFGAALALASAGLFLWSRR